MGQRKAKKLHRYRFGGKDVPHLVLEPTQKCNLRCTACYKHKTNYTKSLAAIKQEVDLALRYRNLDAISILGAEPTLHPDLPEIIKYVSDKNVEVRMLSNGLTLTDELLEQYKKAGLDSIMLHIDSKQNRPDLSPNPTQKEINELRDKLFNKIARHGLRCGLSLTLYRDTLDRFADDIEYVLSSRFANQMLVTEYYSFPGKHLIEKYVPRNEETEDLYQWQYEGGDENNEEDLSIEEAEQVFYDAFRLQPDAYIASNKNLEEKRWVFYYVHSTIFKDGSYRILPYESRSTKYIIAAFERIHKLVYGKYSFLGKVNVVNGQRSFALFEALFSLNPLYLLKMILFIASSFKSGAIFADKLLLIQHQPNLTKDGKFEYCNYCPDATVRNGQLLPICVADLASPVDIEKHSPEVQTGYRKLLEHLEIRL